MNNIEIYTKKYCGYCHRAKALLDDMGLSYTEYDVTQDRDKEAEMIRRSEGYTVPQIFVDDSPVGGSDELYSLAKSGELIHLLGSKPALAEVSGHA